LVVTVHDIGPLTHPEYFSASHPFLLKRALKSAREKASAIICVSRSTADAVENYLRCSLGDRLSVIPEGVSSEFFLQPNTTIAGEPDAHSPQAPYFLWVGSLNPRKNLERVLKAFELIADDVAQDLVVAGGTAWDSDPILRAIQQSPIGHRVHLRGRVTDAQLRRLYRGASAFVFVSLMEGFGLPILEAMASGCPVVTSNISSMPEVAGDAAIQVDPTSVEDIAQSLRRVGLNTDLRRDLSRRGAARAAQFSWNSCANAVAEIYQRVQAGLGWGSSLHRQHKFAPAVATHLDLHETKVS
jgi:glycosyltransferase involved in cell wall biosynthesis